jgi:hypothetical protein
MTRISLLCAGDSEVQRTMLELLNQLDGFEATKNIKVHKDISRIFANVTCLSSIHTNYIPLILNEMNSQNLD